MMGEEEKSHSYCKIIHCIISNLPRFKEPTRVLPKDGIYFFFETGENANHEGEETDRIVRVGTHKASGGLFDRLKKHYTGSKRNSVFLRFVGGALIRKSSPDSLCLQPGPGLGHWEKNDGIYCEKCVPFKGKSKKYIRSKTTFTVIKVPKYHSRDLLEKALVSTISLCTECGPSDLWLGRYSYLIDTQKSGLWQSDYLFDPQLKFSHTSFVILLNSIQESLEYYDSINQQLPKNSD